MPTNLSEKVALPGVHVGLTEPDPAASPPGLKPRRQRRTGRSGTSVPTAAKRADDCDPVVASLETRPCRDRWTKKCAVREVDCGTTPSPERQEPFALLCGAQCVEMRQRQQVCHPSIHQPIHQSINPSTRDHPPAMSITTTSYPTHTSKKFCNTVSPRTDRSTTRVCPRPSVCCTVCCKANTSTTSSTTLPRQAARHPRATPAESRNASPRIVDHRARWLRTARSAPQAPRETPGSHNPQRSPSQPGRRAPPCKVLAVVQRAQLLRK